MKLAKVGLMVLAYLIMADIAAVVVSFILEVLPLRWITTTLFFVVWLVAGVFCGLLAYNTGGRILSPVTEGDWSEAQSSGKYGLTVIGITVLVIAVLVGLFYKFDWQGSGSGGDYVPDNMAMTVTFFVGTLGAMIGGHTMLRPSLTAKKPETS